MPDVEAIGGLDAPTMNNGCLHEHGNRCSCRVLAVAFGINPRAVGFAYCRAVLMKHWVIECNHGCQDAPVMQPRVSKWRNVGTIDPLKAILIKNN